MRYWPYIIGCIIIVFSWYWLAWKIRPLLRRKGYKITKMEFYGVLFILSAVLIALLVTYWKTSGTFIWR